MERKSYKRKREFAGDYGRYNTEPKTKEYEEMLKKKLAKNCNRYGK